MNIILIITFILVILLTMKYIIFLLMMPIIAAQNARRKRKWRGDKNNVITEPMVRSSASFKQRMINTISEFLNAYARYADIRIGYIPSFVLRDFLYKHVFCVNLQNRVTLHYGAEIRSGYKLTIGEGSTIGDRALLDARNGIVFGKDVNVSSDVCIYTEQHDYRDPYFRCDTKPKHATLIDDRAWIGSNVIILPNVHVGEGAVLCAGCVVTKDEEPYTVVAGIPAKKIAERPRGLKYHLGRNNMFF